MRMTAHHMGPVKPIRGVHVAADLARVRYRETSWLVQDGRDLLVDEVRLGNLR